MFVPTSELKECCALTSQGHNTDISQVVQYLRLPREPREALGIL
jgi:hypothetical protein